MGFPDRLYALTGQDLGNRYAEFFIRTNDVTLAQVNVTAQVANDLSGRVVIVTAIAGYYDPGAGQNLDEAFLQLFPPSGTAFHMLDGKGDAALAANRNSVLAWKGEALLPPAWFIRTNVNFNAGVAGNRVVLTVLGWSIPVGTIRPT